MDLAVKGTSTDFHDCKFQAACPDKHRKGRMVKPELTTEPLKVDFFTVLSLIRLSVERYSKNPGETSDFRRLQSHQEAMTSRDSSDRILHDH